MISRTPQHPGSLLVDALLAIVVVGLFGVALTGLASATSRSVTAARHQTEATALAKASMEAVVAVKQADWEGLFRNNQLINDAVVQRATSASQNVFVLLPLAPTADEVVDDVYRRHIRLTFAQRSLDTLSGSFVDTGMIDHNVVRVLVTVRWTERTQERRVEFVQYLSNWHQS